MEGEERGGAATLPVRSGGRINQPKESTIGSAIGIRRHYSRFICSLVLTEKEQLKDKNPEEMNRLRDQLVGTFKEQMDIR